MAKLDVIAMRPFVPAKDFDVSLQFYTQLGFTAHRFGEGLASMHLGPFAFLLQAYYVKDWAENFMMHLLVEDLEGWWERIKGLDLAEHFDVQAPAAPKLQSWGLVVSYLWDPSGVLWHLAEDPNRAQTELI